MKYLTINQLMLLLDFYRGTETQFDMGTSQNDLKHLKKLGLVDSKARVTKSGEDLISQMKDNITYILN